MRWILLGLLSLGLATCASGNEPALRTTGGPRQVTAAQPPQQRLEESTRAPDSSEPDPQAPCSNGAADFPEMLTAANPPAWLPGEDEQGPCQMDEQGHLVGDEFSDVSHEVGNSAGSEFDVSYYGPSGSGRYWGVGLSLLQDGVLHGFCFSTSTVGWRYIGGDNELASALVPLIAWIQDVDVDGNQEFVIRSSFDLGGGDRGDYAITATAYDLQAGQMILDKNSTQVLRFRIADAYQAAQRRKDVTSYDRARFHAAAEHLLKHSCNPR